MGHITNYYNGTFRTLHISEFFRTHFKGKYLHGNDSDIISRSKRFAEEIVRLIPKELDCVLPRGYLVENSLLVLCKSFSSPSEMVLYKPHSQWGGQEAKIFLADFEDGWISELILYLKWHYRHEEKVFRSLQDKFTELGSLLS